MLRMTMRSHDSKTDVIVRVIMGLVLIGIGAYLFYTERQRTVNRRDWLMALSAVLMAVGAIYGFGPFFGSLILVDEMLDMYK